MKRLRTISFLLLLLLMPTGSNAPAVVREYVEDFSTKDFCDTLATTANWDTAAGQVGLFPFEVSVAGHLSSGGRSMDIAVAGDYAFIADWTYGLRVRDISDPAAPAVFASEDALGVARGIDIAGDYAFVAVGGTGGDQRYLEVFDVSDPSAPALIGNYDVPDEARGLAVCGDYAFVGGGRRGFHVIRVLDHPWSADTDVHHADE